MHKLAFWGPFPMVECLVQSLYRGWGGLVLSQVGMTNSVDFPIEGLIPSEDWMEDGKVEAVREHERGGRVN